MRQNLIKKLVLKSCQVKSNIHKAGKLLKVKSFERRKMTVMTLIDDF